MSSLDGKHLIDILNKYHCYDIDLFDKIMQIMNVDESLTPVSLSHSGLLDNKSQLNSKPQKINYRSQIFLILSHCVAGSRQMYDSITSEILKHQVVLHSVSKSQFQAHSQFQAQFQFQHQDHSQYHLLLRAIDVDHEITHINEINLVNENNKYA